ncbi:MAG: LacI family DNA-binding transcriptional regulator [Ancalomicrobiaceae bacterium]|nr:LacI family DNA-binding transcriptional regulator [Ancalomicrobiaceae bacterium]
MGKSSARNGPRQGVPSTIVDVARKAGVSVSTVSHVVNHTRRVMPETRKLVEDAIAVVGYRTNTLARALKMSTTRSVGIAISAASNPYFSDIICAIEAECARLGLIVLLSDTHDDPERELNVVKDLYQRRVDGLILAPASDASERTLRFIESVGLPCVLVDRLSSDRFDQVGVRNSEAMALLVTHLAAFGHRRIGFVAGQAGLATTAERIRGYRTALVDLGLDDDPDLLVTGNPSIARVTESTKALLSLPQPPTALIAGNNMATIGVMRAIRAFGLTVPRDISIVGIDDFEWADCFEPRLTLVAQPCDEIGRQAAALLIERIGSSQGARRTIRLDCTLRQRDSCGPPK